LYKILIIEDDAKISGLIAEELETWGYEVQQTTDFQQVMETFLRIDPQLVILDINLPYYNGFYWCEQMRRHANTPIIFLSSRTEEMDMMMALNMGGDDFIQKPFSMGILVTKIHTLLRRTYTYQSTEVELIGHRELVLNLKKGTVSAGDAELELTRNEFKILSLLLEHKEEVVSREDIMDVLWEGESFIDDNTLTVNVNRLRRKLSSHGLEDYIETKKGIGYRLI